MKQKEIIELIVAVLVIIGMVVGALNYLAKASELQLVEMRLDQKIVSDQIMQLQQRIWQLQDRNYGPCTNWTNQKDKDEYRKIQEEIEMLKKRRDALINRTMKQ